MNLIVTINSNREIVAERWAHLWQDAGISGTADSDREIVDLLCREFTKRLEALGVDFEYDSRFYFWRGGKGQNSGGDFILRDKVDGDAMIKIVRGPEYDAVRQAYDEAESEARAAVAREIADILEAVEDRDTGDVRHVMDGTIPEA